MKRRTTVLVVLLVLMLGMVAAIVPASASVQGRRNTALALTGLAAYELLRGNTGTGVLAGVGAAVAWDRVNQAKQERERERYYGYYPDSGYDQGYYGSDQGYYGSDQGYYGSDSGYYGQDQGYYGRDRDGYGYYSRERDRRYRGRSDRNWKHRDCGRHEGRPSWQSRGNGDWDD